MYLRAKRDVSTSTSMYKGCEREEEDARVRHELLVPAPVVAVLARALDVVARVAVQEHRAVEQRIVVRDDRVRAGARAPDERLDPVGDVVCGAAAREGQ